MNRRLQKHRAQNKVTQSANKEAAHRAGKGGNKALIKR